jgi:hypothetical protein
MFGNHKRSRTNPNCYHETITSEIGSSRIFLRSTRHNERLAKRIALPCASGTHSDMSVAPQLVKTTRTPPRSSVYRNTPSPTHSSVKLPLLKPITPPQISTQQTELPSQSLQTGTPTFTTRNQTSAPTIVSLSLSLLSTLCAIVSPRSLTTRTPRRRLSIRV